MPFKISTFKIQDHLAKAYLWQYRVRANVHWLIGSALGLTPTALILAYVKVGWFPYLDWIFYGTLAAGCLWFFSFRASKNGLTLMLRNRLELTIHVTSSYVSRRRRQAFESFVTDASEAILWARAIGFRTVTMESPFLARQERRTALTADLQLLCGDCVSVESGGALSRITLLEHYSFVWLRRSRRIQRFREALFYCVRNWKWPESDPDGFTRDRGRLMSGRIVITFRNTAPERSAF